MPDAVDAPTPMGSYTPRSEEGFFFATLPQLTINR